MKFKKLWTKNYINNLGMISTIESSKHSIIFEKDLQSFIIDGYILIPLTNVLEATILNEDVTCYEISSIERSKTKK